MTFKGELEIKNQLMKPESENHPSSFLSMKNVIAHLRLYAFGKTRYGN